MKTPRPTFCLIIEALADGSRPPVARLKALLKYALRALRFRCVGIEQVQPKIDGQECPGIVVNPSDAEGGKCYQFEETCSSIRTPGVTST